MAQAPVGEVLRLPCRPNLTQQSQAQPPAAGGQPFPSFLQHHAFLPTLQPAIQLAYPAIQSYGLDVVAHPICPGHPLPWTLQHHAFFPTLQPTCQFAYPSAQLYGSAGLTGATGITGATGGITIGGDVGGHPLWCILQHHAFLSAAHMLSASTAQLNGSPLGTGRVGRGRGLGGYVTGGVGGGVGGCVGVVAGKAVVEHPTPVVMQQYCCCSSDHRSFQFATPWLQSKGREVVNKPDSSHHNSSKSRGSKQHEVIIQVKSLRGLAMSKSPPHPTYL